MNLKLIKQLTVFNLFVLCAVPTLVGPARADLIKQSASYSRQVLMTSSTDHVTGATGLTLTVTVSKAGATYASVTPTVTELGNGVYAIALAAGNTNTLGSLDIHVSASGADPTDTHDQVVGFDPNSDLGAATLATIGTTVTATNTQTSPANQQANVIAGNGTYGTATGTQVGANTTAIAALPTASANGTAAANAILVTPGNKLATSATGTVTAAPGITTALTGTATAGGASTITLAAGPATTDLEKGNYVAITGGTGAGQARTITSWNGSTLVASISRPWAVTPDSTSTYAVIMNPHPALDSNLAVTAGTVSDKAGYTATASNLPTDYQQRGVAVTLPSTILGSADHTAIQADAFGALNQAAPGSPTTGSLFYTEASDLASSTAAATSAAAAQAAVAGIPAAVLARSLGHGMTVGQLLVLLQAANVAVDANVWNANTHTLTTTYQFSGDSSPIRSDNTVFPATQTASPGVVSRTTTTGTIAQP